MRVTTDIFFVLCCLLVICLGGAKHAKKYAIKKAKEKEISTILRSGPGRAAFMGLDLGAHPQPLPSEPPRTIAATSYNNLYQGARLPTDIRVFREKFDHEAMLTGQHVVCQGMFDCVIAHIAIESTEAIPVLLRGGAGYRHFMALVKSKPNRDLKGQVRAYCRSKDPYNIKAIKSKKKRKENSKKIFNVSLDEVPLSEEKR